LTTGLAISTVVVTHDATDARQLGDRIAVLEAGKVTQTGAWEELVQSPASQFIKDFVASEGLRTSGLQERVAKRGA
jgi:molybdate transport system ATP-binding protein